MLPIRITKVLILTIILLSTSLTSAQEFMLGPSAIPFTNCGDTYFDSRDANTYKTVQIGTQCWMAENMSYLPQVDAVSDGSEDAAGKYYYVYGYTPTGADEAEEIANAKLTTNYTNYGVLYNWTAAMDGASSSTSVPSGVQGICPNGWHLPSDGELTILTDFLGGLSVAGGKMKETGTTHWLSPNIATNSSGFTALPSGYRDSNSNFIGMYNYINIWSSEEYNAVNAWYRSLHFNYTSIGRSYNYKQYGFSVRCLKD